jgi:hypothetical protein
MIPQAVVQFDR